MLQLLFLVVCFLSASFAVGAEITWSGNTNTDWQTGSNWQLEPGCTGNCLLHPPRSGDVGILRPGGLFGTHSTAILSDHVALLGVNVLDDMFVDANGFQMDIFGGPLGGDAHLVVDGTGSTLRVADSGRPFDLRVDRFEISNGGLLSLNNAFVTLYSGSQFSEISAGSSLIGSGIIEFTHPNAIGRVLSNSGWIRTGVGGLTLNVLGNAMLDLDGTGGGNGVIDVDFGGTQFEQTLTVNAPLFDGFDGQLLIGSGDRAHLSHPWLLGESSAMGSGLLRIGGVGGGARTVSGGQLTVQGSNSEIRVDSGAWGRFESDLEVHDATMNVGTNSTVEFGNAFFYPTAELNTGPGYDLVVNGSLQIEQSLFDWDSTDPQNHRTTINGGRRSSV